VLVPGHIRTPTGQDDRGVPGFVLRQADSQPRGHLDSGGASRFYPQFEDDWALLAWVTKLVTPA
jgi:hypothetical protein